MFIISVIKMTNTLYSEVNDINRQKFLAELGRLLTFRSEEERQDALAMYNKLFDDCTDEQSLLALLSSPTRQAVLIARAYNAGQTPEDEEAKPPYAVVIDKLRETAQARELIADKDSSDDQISIFDETPAPAAEEKEEPDETAAASESDETSAAEDETSESPEESEKVEEEKTEESIAPEKSDERGMGFRFDEEGNLVFEEAAAEPEKDEEAKTEESIAPRTAEAQEELIPRELPDPLFDSLPETVRKPKVGLLILFILLAVPLTLAGLIALLAPTFASLTLAGLLGCVGVIAVTAAFGGGFAMFANVLVVLGVAAMLLALSLLFLWMFIWFIGCVMVGLVSGVIALGRKWCYKEVKAE